MAALTVVAAGAAVGARLGEDASAPAAAVPAGAGVTAPGPSPAPAAPSPAPPPPPPGGPVVFEGAVLTLPPGWALADAGDGTGCVSRAPGGCDLQLVLPDVVRDRGGQLEDPASDRDLGWHLGTDAADCRSSELVVRDLAPFGDKRAEYREWDLDCTGEPARLRLWWLPRTRFAAFDRTGDPAVASVVGEVLRSADLTGLRAG